MKGDNEDLIAIRDAIYTCTLIQERVSGEPVHMSSSQLEDWRKLEALTGRMKDLTALATRISEAIDEEALKAVKVVGPVELLSFPDAGDFDNGTKTDKRQPIFTTRPQYVFAAPIACRVYLIHGSYRFSHHLLSYHQYLREAASERELLQERLRKEFCEDKSVCPIRDAKIPFPTDAESLTLRHSPQHGFYVHIGKIRRDDRHISHSPDVISIAKSKSTRAYAHKVRVYTISTHVRRSD